VRWFSSMKSKPRRVPRSGSVTRVLLSGRGVLVRS
jgi:hypothetical protein